MIILGAIAAAFSAGLLAFISPCVLPMAPMYVAYISGVSVKDMEGGKKPIGKFLINFLFFFIGFTIVFVAFITLFQGVLSNAQVVKDWIYRILAVLLLIFGLQTAGVFNIPFLNFTARLSTDAKTKDPTVISSFVLGFVFGFGWTPCVVPFLLGVIGIASKSNNLVLAIVQVIVFSIGLGLPFLLAGLATKQLMGVFKNIKKHFKVIEVISGIFLIGIGLYIGLSTFDFTGGDPLMNFRAKNLITDTEVAVNDGTSLKKLVFLFDKDKLSTNTTLLDSMNALQRDNTNIQIIAIAMNPDCDRRTIKSFAEKNGIAFSISRATPALRKKVTNTPAYYLISTNKQVLGITNGVLSSDEIKSFVTTGDVEFSVPDIYGKEVISVEKYRGKVVFLNFWATWCGPCLKEMPELVKLQEKYKDDLVIIGASVDKDSYRDKVLEVMKKKAINYRMFIAPSDVISRFKAGTVPVTYIYSRDGKKSEPIVGSHSFEDFEKMILPYIKKK